MEIIHNKTPTMGIWGFIILAGLVSGVPAILIKLYIDSPDNPYKWLYILLSFVAYAILLYCYLQIFVDCPVGIYYSIIKIMSIVLVAVIAILFFKETITPINMVGFVLGILAILALSH